MSKPLTMNGNLGTLVESGCGCLSRQDDRCTLLTRFAENPLARESGRRNFGTAGTLERDLAVIAFLGGCQ